MHVLRTKKKVQMQKKENEPRGINKRCLKIITMQCRTTLVPKNGDYIHFNQWLSGLKLSLNFQCQVTSV